MYYVRCAFLTIIFFSGRHTHFKKVAHFKTNTTESGLNLVFWLSHLNDRFTYDNCRLHFVRLSFCRAGDFVCVFFFLRISFHSFNFYSCLYANGALKSRTSNRNTHKAFAFQFAAVVLFLLPLEWDYDSRIEIYATDFYCINSCGEKKCSRRERERFRIQQAKQNRIQIRHREYISNHNERKKNSEKELCAVFTWHVYKLCAHSLVLPSVFAELFPLQRRDRDFVWTHRKCI